MVLYNIISFQPQLAILWSSYNIHYAHEYALEVVCVYNMVLAALRAIASIRKHYAIFLEFFLPYVSVFLSRPSYTQGNLRVYSLTREVAEQQSHSIVIHCTQRAMCVKSARSSIAWTQHYIAANVYKLLLALLAKAQQ